MIMKGTKKNIFQSVLVLGLLLAGEGMMWGGGSKYYVSVSSSSSPTGVGNVYVQAGDDYSSRYEDTIDFASSSSSNSEKTFYAYYPEVPSGYHFIKWQLGENGSAMGDFTYNKSGSSGSWDENEIKFTVKTSDTPAESEEKPNAREYRVEAVFLPNWYYGKLQVNSGTGGIASTTEATKHTTTSGGTLTFDLKAVPNDGYHFYNWTGSTGVASATAAETTFSAKAATAYDEGSAASYTVQANFEENYYTKVTVSKNIPAGGTAYVKFGETFSEEKTEDSNGYGRDKGGITETYSLKATPADGYYFIGWEVTNGSLTDASEQSTTVKVTTNAGYKGAANKYPCTVTAKFKQYEYKAKLSTAKSSVSEGTGSVAEVSSDNTNWGPNALLKSESPNVDLQFYVRAIPESGYRFFGWAEADGSETVVEDLGAEGIYIVKSSSTQGSTNEKTLYAIFKKEYSIVINASGTASTDRIIFNVTGPQNYRVSVPVGGSVKLKDVAAGDYTVTPEATWSWSYTVSPESSDTAFSATNTSTHNFTVTPSGTTKKHAEVGKTVTTGE